MSEAAELAHSPLQARASTMHEVQDVTGWPSHGEEQVGSKPKAWLLDPNNVSWLFKQPRRDTGEHWAEVIAADVANLLRLPHAVARLARRGDVLGSISRDFRGETGPKAELVLGNTLLTRMLSNYDSEAAKPSLHTVDVVVSLLARSWIAPPLGDDPPAGVSLADSYFVGYLLLDALIGNTDRHHENWGLILRRWDD